MEYRLKKGEAPVLFGAKGSGKTAIAKKMAKENSGKCLTVNMEELMTPFGLGFLNRDIGTVIVEGFTGRKEQLRMAKLLVSEKKILVERKGQDAVLEALPNFIFCTGHKNPIPSIMEERRFIVIKS